MYLFQRATGRFWGYYNSYRRFEYDKTHPAYGDKLVYLDDYILAWLVFGDGIEMCGKDFSVLMQVHTALLLDLMQMNDLFSNPELWEDENGDIRDDEFPHGEVPQRLTAHPISALGTCLPGQNRTEYDTSRCGFVDDHKGLIHPAFLKEWFDHIAALPRAEREDEWFFLWVARNEAVVKPE